MRTSMTIETLQQNACAAYHSMTSITTDTSHPSYHKTLGHSRHQVLAYVPMNLILAYVRHGHIIADPYYAVVLDVRTHTVVMDLSVIDFMLCRSP